MGRVQQPGHRGQGGQLSGALDIPWRQRRGGAGGMQRALESCDFVPITKKAPGVPSTRTSPSPETVEGMDEVQTSSSAKADAHAMPTRSMCSAISTTRHGVFLQKISPLTKNPCCAASAVVIVV
jgi:hypothetical protein